MEERDSVHTRADRDTEHDLRKGESIRTELPTSRINVSVRAPSDARIRVGTHRAERDNLQDARQKRGLDAVHNEPVDEPVSPAPCVAMINFSHWRRVSR